MIEASETRVQHDEARPGRAAPRMRLRTGHELHVLDISERGARVEGHTRLLPGTSIEIHLDSGGRRVPVRGRVLRSRVCRLSAESICYESVLTFDAVPQLEGL